MLSTQTLHVIIYSHGSPHTDIYTLEQTATQKHIHVGSNMTTETVSNYRVPTKN